MKLTSTMAQIYPDKMHALEIKQKRMYDLYCTEYKYLVLSFQWQLLLILSLLT